jgi:hypothetical protein
MPIFTAVAAAVSAFVGGGVFGAVAGFAARTLLTIGITKLVANKAGKTAAGTGDAGSRIQLPPASNNKLPVVYGTAYMAPIITDAKISTDQKTMWYVCTLAEVTDTGSYSFGDIYWGGKKVVFDGTDTAKVVQLETNSDPVQVDDTVNGKIYIYKFPNGSASGISTGGSSAITLLSDSSIPTDQRWNGPIYTTGGESAAMSNTAFLVVKVIYDSNANTTRLEQMSVELTNSLTKPGDVLKDYMTNNRYGCAIAASDIDSASITTLNNYSDELITYHPVGGGTATQARYRINGPVNTGQNCLNNLQELVDACDSWLQYSELSGKWTIVVNKPYDWDGTTLADLYQVTDDVLISGISVNPIDLNNAYNQLEVQYPDTQVNDQTNYNVINLIDFAPEVMSPNEPENKLTVQFPQVNNYIQSTYLGIRRMLQSREDLVIDCLLDYSGIQVQAGDVVCIPFAPYGWEAFNSGYGKLFRVSQVQEAKLDDGSLGARITAFEYNGTVYADDPIQDYVAESNTGLTDPNIFDRPTTPIVTLAPVANGAINYYSVSSNVPAVGTTLYMDFNIGNSSNIQTHKSYTSVQVGDGTPYTANSTITINVADSSPGTYYWSATARNDIAGRQSNSSASFTWAGPSVTTYNANTGTGGITPSQINSDVYGVGRIISGINFAIANTVANIITPPIAVSSSTLNVPVIIPSTTIANTNNYPPFQNTSSNGTTPLGNSYYRASSTGSYAPANSWVYVGNPGTDSWYAILGDNWSANTIKSYENMTSNFGVVLVSDAPAKVQIAQGLLLDGLGYFITDMSKMGTFYFLEANNPIRIELNEIFLGNGANMVGTSVICRNINDGTNWGGNVTLVSGSLSVTASKNPYV